MANRDVHKEVGFHFAAWLADSDLRRYLLHFSDAQWLHVAQCTLLLGLGYLEFHNVHVPARSEGRCSLAQRQEFCEAFEQLAVMTTPFRESGRKTYSRSKAFIVIPAQCQTLRRLGEQLGPAGAGRQGSQQRKSYQQSGTKSRVQKMQPTRAWIAGANHDADTRFPGEYAAYLTLRRFLMIFPEFGWPAVLKKLFVLGLKYLDFLGVPLHMLGLSQLRAIAYEYGGPVVGDATARCHVRNRVRSLLPASTAKGGSVALKDLHSQNAQRGFSVRRSHLKLKRPPRLLRVQQVFPFQWVTPSWIDSRIGAHGAEKMFPVARYPSWWSTVVLEEETADTSPKSHDHGGMATKKHSKGRPSYQRLSAPGPRSAEGCRAVTLLPFQKTAGLCVVRHTVAIGTSSCTKKGVKPHGPRARGCRVHQRESVAQSRIVQSQRRRRLSKFRGKKPTELTIEKDVLYVSFVAGAAQHQAEKAQEFQQDRARHKESVCSKADRLTSSLASPRTQGTAESFQPVRRSASGFVASSESFNSEKATILRTRKRGDSLCQGASSGRYKCNQTSEPVAKKLDEKKRQTLVVSSGESSTTKSAVESIPSPGRIWRESLRSSAYFNGEGDAGGGNDNCHGAAALVGVEHQFMRKGTSGENETTGEAPTRCIRRVTPNLFDSYQKIKKQSTVCFSCKPALPLHIVAHTEQRWQRHIL